MANASPLMSPRESEIIHHYVEFLGQPNDIWLFDDLPAAAATPIRVLAFAPLAADYDWIYSTVGVGSTPSTNGADDHAIELMIYSRQQIDELGQVLAKLALYPIVHQTHFGVGHTIAGQPGEGVVHGSQLTEFILLPVYFEAEGFDTFALADGSHIQILCATPISLTERHFAREHGWRRLVELFVDQDVPIGNLWREAML